MSKELQHYVPRFLLKNFTKGKKPQIFVYDKSNDKQFKTNIKNIAAETGFYDIEIEGGEFTLEPGLSHLESNTSGIINKIVKERSILHLDEKERAILAVFLAVQFVRTKEHRIRFEQMGDLLREKLIAIGASEENIAELIGLQDGVPEEKMIGFKSIMDAEEFVPHFLNKTWGLFETNAKHPLYTSDNPITLHNENDYGFRGNIGLAVKGIQIYIPLSSTLCLGLLCPSIGDEFKKGYQDIKFIDKHLPGMVNKHLKNADATREFCECIENGTPIQLTEDHVTFMNSLQVMYSSRFVYCQEESLGLVKEMVTDDDKYRTGLKASAS